MYIFAVAGNTTIANKYIVAFGMQNTSYSWMLSQEYIITYAYVLICTLINTSTNNENVNKSF